MFKVFIFKVFSRRDERLHMSVVLHGVWFKCDRECIPWQENLADLVSEEDVNAMVRVMRKKITRE